MEDRREQRGGRDIERVGDVPRVARTPGGDHRQGHDVPDLLEEVDVVALARAVAVDRGDEQLARAALLALARPLDRVARSVLRRGVRAPRS